MILIAYLTNLQEFVQINVPTSLHPHHFSAKQNKVEVARTLKMEYLKHFPESVLRLTAILILCASLSTIGPRN